MAVPLPNLWGVSKAKISLSSTRENKFARFSLSLVLGYSRRNHSVVLGFRCNRKNLCRLNSSYISAVRMPPARFR
jgi:hypothetical protein